MHTFLVLLTALLLLPASAHAQIHHSAGKVEAHYMWTIGSLPGSRYARYSQAGRVAPAPSAIQAPASSGARVWPVAMRDVLHVWLPATPALRRASLFSIGGIATGVELRDGRMNVEALPAGLYVLRLDFHGGKSEQFKLIK